MTEVQPLAPLEYDKALRATEGFLHKYCKDNYCEQYGVKPEQFRIVLLNDFKNELGLVAGPVVQVLIPWPAAQPFIKSRLQRALRYIDRNGLLNTFTTGKIHLMNQKVWKRYPFDDIADVSPDVLPSEQFRKTVSHTVTLVHRDTGISHSVLDKTGNRPLWDMQQECRVELSRIVNETYRLLAQTRVNFKPSVALQLVNEFEYVQNELSVMWDLIKLNDPETYGTYEDFMERYTVNGTSISET